MKWTSETRLTLSVEKDHVRIYVAQTREEIFFYAEPDELIYEPVDKQ